MCSRFAMNKQTDELIADFVAQGGKPENWPGSYSIAPRSRAPIVRERSDADGTVNRDATVARWDWPKPPSRPSGAPIINARIEKLPTPTC